MENQVKKLKMNSYKKFLPTSLGVTVWLPIPEVDKGKDDSCNMLAIMMVIQKVKNIWPWCGENQLLWHWTLTTTRSVWPKLQWCVDVCFITHKIENPAKCEMHNVIQFLNATEFQPIELYRQIMEFMLTVKWIKHWFRKWCIMFNKS